MESLPEDPFLEFLPDTLQEVRKMYNLEKPGEMKEAVNIFDAWVKQQNHFVKKDFSREYLERMIIACKGSIERAKQRLDRLCTMRTLMPEFFREYDIRADFNTLKDNNILYCALPKMTPKYERVYFIRDYCKGEVGSTIFKGFKQCVMMTEYLKAHDYAASYMFIVDIRECNVTSFITNVGIMDFRNTLTIVTEGYGMRLTGIHILTNLKVLDALLALLRTVMSAKIASRIRIHRSLESIYEVAPKEVLPKEYGEGGEDRSLDEINEMWMNILTTKEHKEYHREMTKAATNETCRQTDTFNEQYMGMPGTFRTLKVD